MNKTLLILIVGQFIINSLFLYELTQKQDAPRKDCYLSSFGNTVYFPPNKESREAYLTCSSGIFNP